MNKGKKEYSEDDVICHRCIKDYALREIFESEGSKEVCALCGMKNVGVTVRELAGIVDPIIRENFKLGHFERRYGSGDDDGYWEEQQGEDLSYVLQEILGQYGQVLVDIEHSYFYRR